MKNKLFLSCLISCVSASVAIAMESSSSEEISHASPVEVIAKGKEKDILQSPEISQEILEENPGSSSSKLSLVTPQKPISTGFFDRLDQDRIMSNDAKMKKFNDYVHKNHSRYELILEQLGATYFRKECIDNKELFKCVDFVREFFESKIDNLDKKAIEFQSHQEQISQESRETFKFSPIGTYSGKLHENPEQQEEYAYKKYKDWDFIYQFTSNFPIAKGSLNPIAQQAIITFVARSVESHLKGMTHCTNAAAINDLTINSYNQIDKTRVMEFLKPLKLKELIHNLPSLNDMIADKHSLLAYSKKQREKWHKRCGIRQKLNEVSELYEKRVSIRQQQAEEREESEL